MTKLEILESFLKFTEDVIRNDKTPWYDFGCQNGIGEFPERWLTPREMAREEQIDIKREIELTKSEVGKC